MFIKLPSNSRALLKEILESENPSVMLAVRFEKCSDLNKEDELRGIIAELTQRKYISVLWADDVPCEVAINNAGRTYDEQEAEYERQMNSSANSTNNFYGDAKDVQIQQGISGSA